MTTEEKARLAELRAELSRCPEGSCYDVLGETKLVELLGLLMKEQAQPA